MSRVLLRSATIPKHAVMLDRKINDAIGDDRLGHASPPHEKLGIFNFIGRAHHLRGSIDFGLMSG
jgi:hypothetical protein